MSTEPDVPGVVAPPPLIYLGGLAAGFVLEALLPSASVPAGVRWGLGAALVVGGLSLMGSFVRTFGSARTNVNPYRPTTAIVTTGPYRLTRNPGYLGMALVFSGIALLSSALWPFATLPPTIAIIHRGVILREERYLERKFGAQYLAYRSRVRRWL